MSDIDPEEYEIIPEVHEEDGPEEMKENNEIIRELRQRRRPFIESSNPFVVQRSRT